LRIQINTSAIFVPEPDLQEEWIVVEEQLSSKKNFFGYLDLHKIRITVKTAALSLINKNGV
jgi:hypothetical protein